MIDMSNYKKFNELKLKYPTKMVYITESDIHRTPKDLSNPRGHVEYIDRRFKDEGVIITRFNHNYTTGELGLVFLAGDSVVNPGYEVWALIGYNAQYATQE